MGPREWTVPMERVSYSGEEPGRGEPITLICHSLVILDLILPLTEEEGRREGAGNWGNKEPSASRLSSASLEMQLRRFLAATGVAGDTRRRNTLNS